MELHSSMFLDGADRNSIASDPEFSSWTNGIPRMWFSAQQRLLQLDSSQIYGSQLSATGYSRTTFESLPVISDTGARGLCRYTRPTIDSMIATADSAVRRTSTTFYGSETALATIVDFSTVVLRTGSGLVTNVVRRTV